MRSSLHVLGQLTFQTTLHHAYGAFVTKLYGLQSINRRAIAQTHCASAICKHDHTGKEE